MDLKELVPQVPQNVPELKPGDTGIYVVTLQIWLQMLKHDCGLVDGIFGDEVEEQVLKFRQKVMKLNTNSGAVDVDTWKKMDALLRDRLPPNPDSNKPLPFPKKIAYESDEAYQYAVKKGLERFGFQIDELQSTYYFEIDETGIGIWENIPPGIYELEIVDKLNEVTALTDYHEDRGSLEVLLFDENEKPVSGKIKLTNRMLDPDSLKKAIRLFKAMGRELDVLETKDGSEVNPSVINGELSNANQKLWEAYPAGWGRFYGAPWMGVLYDPVTEDSLKYTENENNWTSYETAQMLYQWGQEQLNSVGDQNYRHLAVRYLNHCYGGLINNRSDLSQIGQALSLHLPRKTSRQVNGKDSGQDYGLIDYQSPEYHRPAYAIMFRNLLKIGSEYQLRCQDQQLVRELSEGEEEFNRGDLVWNSYLSDNTELNKVSAQYVRMVMRFDCYIDAKDADNYVEKPKFNYYDKRIFPVADAIVSVTDVNGEVMDLRTGKIKSNKGKIESVKTSFYGNVKLPKKFLKKDPKDPRAPYTIKITTTDQQQATWKVNKVVGDKLVFDSIGTYFNYATDDVIEGLYELKNNKWRKLPGKQAYTQYKSTLDEKFITSHIVPALKRIYHLDDDQEIVSTRDDYYDSSIRSDDFHYAIDIGSRVLHKDENAYRSFNEKIKVYPVLEGGYIKTSHTGQDTDTGEYLRLGVDQKICFAEGNLRLVLVLIYVHVETTEHLPLYYIKYKQGQSVATLYLTDEKNLWNGYESPYVTSDDPEVKATDKRKGNHVHFRIKGIFDRKTGLDDNETYKKERRTFYNGILLPEIMRRTNEKKD